MSEDRATVDINALRRNLTTPRTGQSPAEYAQALHAESLEQHAKWPERVMLFLAGAFAAALIFMAMTSNVQAARRDCCPQHAPEVTK